MQSEVVLRAHVGQLRRRVRLLVTARWVLAALGVASLLCCLLVVMDRLEWFAAPPEYLAGVLAVGALFGAAVGWTRRVSLMDAAQLADRRLGLQERLSSGIDFLEHGAGDPMTAAQLVDAAERSQKLRPQEVFPFRAPREAKFLAVSLVVLAGLIFVPELSVFQSPRVRADKAAMKQEGEKIEKLAKDYRKREAHPNSDIAKRIAANMQALGKEMRRGRVSKKQAMLRMSRLSKEMRDAQRQVATANTPRSLDQAAQDLKKAADRAQRQGSSPESAKMMADMARALGNKDYDAAARTLQQLAKKLESGEMKPEEAKAAANALAKMAAAMKGTSLDAAAKQTQEAAQRLAAAAKSAAPGVKQAMREAMRQAAKSTAQAGGT